MIYGLCKNVINSGNYEQQSMQNKLDVFLLGNRITSTQYTELCDLMDSQEAIE
ncbi:hypothetical protein [Viridibacillus arvi]|uniref:hypothetical protein n=1 Tax=Viridibacillus arvi TaxID=263475 RepID=UPI00187B6052|nr:hypothetical protein [Viridibacillus sp. JNUCC-6]QOV10945.1 hypothetical protein JNUCC6_20650 [Viridibacillus sp. JNUCC-6]